MKWSFTAGLESNSVGFNLPFGNKRETTKKSLLNHQNMHNLQRKFDALLIFFFFKYILIVVQKWNSVLLSSGYNEKGHMGRIRHKNTTA